MSYGTLDHNLIAPFIKKLIDFTEMGKIVWRQYGLTEEIGNQYLHKTLNYASARFFHETQSLPDLLLIMYRQDTDSSEMATILKIICNDAFGTEAIISQEEFQPDLWMLLGVVSSCHLPDTEKSINMLIQEFLNA